MMKSFLKSILYFIATAIIMVAISTVIRTLRPVPVFDFEIEYAISESAVGPGDSLECSPVITNTGNIDGYVSFEITQPLVPDEDTPLYIIDINDPWQKNGEHILGDDISTTYIYTVPLKPGETTVPLCNVITMAQIPLPTYARIDDINFSIEMYVEEVE